MTVCLLGLGSNQGNRRAALAAAAARLAASENVTLLAVSSWRETAPIGGPPGQPPFLNGALTLETSLGPRTLLELTQRIEHALGRRRDERWGPRTMDLDILLFGRRVIESPALKIPHPRMAFRRFVLEPAAEVAGNLLHPTIGWTVARLLEHLNTARPYLAVTGPIAAGKTRLAKQLAAALSARLISERPDWRGLGAFYADPARRAWQTEMHFLEHRAALLDAASPAWSDPGWTVSDFWFDQSAAFARAWLSEEQMPPYLERFAALRRGVVPPKLIVLLDAEAEELSTRVRRRGRACERPLTGVQLERIRRAVREEALRPGAGPVLQPAPATPEAVLAETLAAVQGME